MSKQLILTLNIFNENIKDINELKRNMSPTFKFKGKYNRTLTFSNDTLHIKQEKSWFKKEREVTVHIDEIKDVYFDKVGGVFDRGPHMCFSKTSFFITDDIDGNMEKTIGVFEKDVKNLLCFYFDYIPGIFKENEIVKEIERLYSYINNYRDDRLERMISKVILEDSTLDITEKLEKLNSLWKNDIIHIFLFWDVKRKLEKLL